MLFFRRQLFGLYTVLENAIELYHHILPLETAFIFIVHYLLLFLYKGITYSFYYYFSFCIVCL